LEEVVLEPEPSRLNIWPFVAGGLAVILVGFIVGLTLPREGAAEDQSLGATPETTLPDVIIPPAPDLPEQSGSTTPSLIPAPVVDEIFAIPAPPVGWEVISNFTQASSDRVDQMIILTNGLTEIRVSAFAAASEPELPLGDDVTVRGQQGAVTRPVEGRFVVSWIEPGKITFSIDAPDEFGLPEVLSLAEALELK
jgi:hypothetical protein